VWTAKISGDAIAALAAEVLDATVEAVLALETAGKDFSQRSGSKEAGAKVFVGPLDTLRQLGSIAPRRFRLDRALSPLRWVAFGGFVADLTLADIAGAGVGGRHDHGDARLPAGATGRRVDVIALALTLGEYRLVCRNRRVQALRVRLTRGQFVPAGPLLTGATSAGRPIRLRLTFPLLAALAGAALFPAFLGGDIAPQADPCQPAAEDPAAQEAHHGTARRMRDQGLCQGIEVSSVHPRTSGGTVVSLKVA
jgi:hypothetical protein